MTFTSNPQIDLAFDYVRNTHKNIFLTGKAGTGKTTFLHQLQKENSKRMVVVAPTGVAAINAGGMTIHSFFQLPFGPYWPGKPKEARQKRKFRKEKINLIRSLDLLVIDEISMVRADMLDHIDEVLRRYRHPTKAFGGVQLLMIGDLHQLPPVVKHEEWHLLKEHYNTAYFFGSLALQQTDPITIELKHIYRQSDDVFINLLNKVRDNKMDKQVLDTLNSRYRANFRPDEADAYITLTAHNASAQRINAKQLDAIPQALHTFDAEIKGDFPAHAYPTAETLSFKKDAQVMFVKNDPDPAKLFYNGKIGKITKIEKDAIYVLCPNETSAIRVSPLEWENTKYTLNEQTKEVSSDVVGTFEQYPLKLAWAITIHKSQGLTFERAIIDAQAAFAHGQVYVALSRCKSFEGIVLQTKINYSSVKTDSVVKNYSEEAEKNAPDETHLKESKKEFQATLLQDLFAFDSLKRRFYQLNRTFLEHESSFTGTGFADFKALAVLIKESIFNIADKFKPQLTAYLNQANLPEHNEKLQDRIQKASVYFSDKFKTELLTKAKEIHIITDNKTVAKKAKEQLENLQMEIFTNNACFEVCKTAFSPQDFLRVKANAELDFKEELKQKSSSNTRKFSHAAQTAHPELFFQLTQWRKDEAADREVEHYRILATRSIVELVEYLPTSKEGLMKINGIGKAKCSTFGMDIIAMITKYCKEKNIETDLKINFAPITPPKPKKTPTKEVTYNMYKAGKTIDEIALARGYVRTTIEGHLGFYIGQGELDIFDLMERPKVEELKDFFIKYKTKSSSEAKGHFGENYSYAEIKMVLEYMKTLETV